MSFSRLWNITLWKDIFGCHPRFLHIEIDGNVLNILKLLKNCHIVFCFYLQLLNFHLKYNIRKIGYIEPLAQKIQPVPIVTSATHRTIFRKRRSILFVLTPIHIQTHLAFSNADIILVFTDPALHAIPFQQLVSFQPLCQPRYFARYLFPPLKLVGGS